LIYMALPEKDPARILVVEDDPGISGMLVKILEENGYIVHSASEGASALALLKSVLPDLVLLDLHVPEKAGFDVLKEIRKRDQEFGLFIPVIILTGATTSQKERMESLEAGADDFLRQPFDLIELLARVKSLLRVRDLTKRAQYLATHDPLTRCYNRRYLLDFLNREFERYRRFKKPFCFIMVDLDHFKAINEELGTEAGDQALTYIGYRLQDFFRAVDCVARLGGDEFAAVLPDCGPAEVLKVGDRLMSALAKSDEGRPPLSVRLKGKIRFSAGIACLPEHTKDKEELIRLADEALYAAKKAGRNSFRVYQAKK
jgi:two-component system cell cycle response regulator